jgi:hypothetical protein
MKSKEKNTDQANNPLSNNLPPASLSYFDNLVYWKLQDGVWYTDELIKELFSGEIAPESNPALLINAANNAAVNLECMRCILSLQGSSRKVIALVTEDNIATSLLIGFFINSNKPSMPFRLFKTDELAQAWIKEELARIQKESLLGR